ncbi:ATP-binding protein [Paenibacillus sp. KN14-4R]|uniref:ATP-binding protein n=1 Tax=Paenibacillus sp. KN14-4R TaxID=3445773 RepID=UPI003F9F9282
MNRLRIYWKIMLLAFGLVLFSLLIGGVVVIGSVSSLKEDSLREKLTTTAQTVANLPSIAEHINMPDAAAHIAPVANKIKILNHVEYIVVLDMNRTRLSHPLSERIGTTFQEEDADAAFAEHMYVTKVRGEKGVGLRAFVPIMNENHEQVGVVVVGGLMPTFLELIPEQKRAIIVTILLSLSFGMFGSAMLARHIKREMYNLEPHEIASMYREHTAAFQAMHEGVIAIDRNERITIFNERAKQIFDVKQDVIDQYILDIIPGSRLPEILELKVPVLNHELLIGGTLIWSNRIPIIDHGVTMGAIAIFQDRTDVTRMAEELTGVKEYVNALRAQNHEHMNKMHTVAGLIQLGKYDEALRYLFEVSDQQEELTKFIQEHFEDDGVAGLLLGKVSRGKELDIEVTIDSKSIMRHFPDSLDRHDIVLLLGNLIENAFDALATSNVEQKTVFISVEHDDEWFSILVEDNGCGISEETKARILEQGFSTKQGEHRGMGLYLLNAILIKGKGELRCDSTEGLGTAMEIIFPMREEV